MTVRAARRLVVRTRPAVSRGVARSSWPGRPSALATCRTSRRRQPRATAGNGKRGEPDPEFEALVARASEYLSGYFREFKNVVAEEDYTQMNMSVRPAEIRRTKSDFLLAMAPDGKSLVPFRDVFEVDGRPVRDREDRLKKLFLEAPSNGGRRRRHARAERGGALQPGLDADHRQRAHVSRWASCVEPFIDGSFEFRRGREETVENVRVVRVDFEEVGTPDRDLRGGHRHGHPVLGLDLGGPADRPRPEDLRPRPPTRRPACRSKRRSPTGAATSLGLWVPSEMRETYRLRGYSIDGRASYSNFRSFQVKTQQEIKVEKK